MYRIYEVSCQGHFLAVFASLSDIEAAKQELIATGEYGNIELKDITDGVRFESYQV